MTWTGLTQRTTCAACSTSCRVAPTEITWREKRGPSAGWLYAARDLCPPCRTAQKAFWFRPVRLPRPHEQLRLLSDADAPIRAVERAERRLSRADLADLATVRRYGA